MALQAPFPYYGGKGRWASEIWERFGDPDVYSEPFAGSLAVLLARDKPCRREVVSDLDGHIANFWRAIRAEPETVAYHADWPTYHQDLTARHGWIQRTREERSAALMADPDWYDAKAAGWWAWGVSNWIGGGFGTDASLKKDGTPKDIIPALEPTLGTGNGIQVQKAKVPADRIPLLGPPRGLQVQKERVPKDRIPHVSPTPGSGQGVQVQKATVPVDRIPSIDKTPGSGLGVQAQRSQTNRDYIPHVGGGQGTQVQRDYIPYFGSVPGGRGVQAQREGAPVEVRDQRPDTGNLQGRGISAQRDQVPADRIPVMKAPQGVQAQREVWDQRPVIKDISGTGSGVQAQRDHLDGEIGSGERLIPWFQALARRLAKVYVLARSWESCVTRAVLGDYEASGKPTIAVFLDPPYVTGERSDSMYGSDAAGTSTDTAAAAYAWAVEHGDRYRIAYAMHEGDFPVPSGWSSSVQSFTSGREGAVDQVIFSPACDEVGQQRLF